MGNATQLVAHKTAQQSWPAQGNRELPVSLDFTGGAVVNGDLSGEMQHSQIESIQSIFIDNSLSSSSFTIQFPITGQILFVPSFKQAILPVIEPGAIRYIAKSNSGLQIPVIFSNTMKTYCVWGPADGTLTVPPLTNPAFAPLALINGDNVLVAGVAAKTIRMFRGVFNVGAATVLLFTDGPGGAVLFSAFLTAGGSLTFQPTGIPWFNTSPGNSLVLNSSAAVNLYGGYGYVQS